MRCDGLAGGVLRLYIQRYRESAGIGADTPHLDGAFDRHSAAKSTGWFCRNNPGSQGGLLERMKQEQAVGSSRLS